MAEKGAPYSHGRISRYCMPNATIGVPNTSELSTRPARRSVASGRGAGGGAGGTGGSEQGGGAEKQNDGGEQQEEHDEERLHGAVLVVGVVLVRPVGREREGTHETDQ